MAAPASPNSSQFQNKIVRWIDYRLPVFTFMKHELEDYPTPRNINYF